MSAPKLSIVVPVYNVEKYLANCLDSLLAQYIRDLEIIVVDDGSPDASGVIADNYAAADSRVRVIHKDNCGLGPARNSGIEAATGEYIGFVDSDDWVEPNMFLGLYEAGRADNADIVVGGYEIWSDGKKAYASVHPLAGRTVRGKGSIEQHRRMLYGRLPEDGLSEPWPVEVWTSIYKLDLIKDSNVRFKNVLSEDTFFNLDIEKYAECITYVCDCGYRYRKDRQPSITNSFDSRTISRFTELFRELVSVAQSDGDPDDALLRSKRKILDYGRVFVYSIEKSDLRLSQKLAIIAKFVEAPEFIGNTEDYPTTRLSWFQSLFHHLLMNGNYRSALLMARAKRLLKGNG